MKRRNVLLGLGTAAAGSGILFGSGAFTQVQAERDLTIGIDRDSEALLALEANEDVASVFEDDSTGELVIDTDELSEGDQGFNVGSTVQIGRTTDGTFGTEVDDEDFAFKVVNNFDDGSEGEFDPELDVAIDLTDFAPEDEDATLEFVTTRDDGNGLEDSATVTGGERLVFDTVESKEEIYVAIRIETDSPGTDPEDLDGEVVFQAGSDLSGEDFPSEVSNQVENDDTGETFATIQGGVDNAEAGQTLLLDDAEFEEQVEINVEGLTLEAAEGASPTVDGQGEIPVLVDGAEDVTVDDENINFESGIDVGADFSDYEPGIDEGDADAIVTGDANGDNEFESIGAALEKEDAAGTTVLVKSDYDASNEDSDNAGSSSALISIVQDNVEIISEEGPEETVIDERPDAGGDGRAVDINAANVVFQGFDVADAAQEGIVVTGVEEAEGIEITDNKITSSVDGILVSEYEPEDFDSASTNQILIANNEVHSERIGISVSDNAVEPVIENNTVTGENDNAIQVSDGAKDAVVEGNLSAGDNRDDLVVTGSVQKSVNNHFVSDDRYAVRLTTERNLDVANNWFGTEDRSTIEGRIEEEESEGEVTFDPFAGAPVDPDAGDDSDN